MARSTRAEVLERSADLIVVVEPITPAPEAPAVDLAAERALAEAC